MARLFKTRRTGILGDSDFETDFLAAEVKVLKSLPKWLTDIYGQANKNCPLGKHPIAIIKKKNREDKEAFVIMRLKNFMYCFFREEK